MYKLVILAFNPTGDITILFEECDTPILCDVSLDEVRSSVTNPVELLRLKSLSPMNCGVFETLRILAQHGKLTVNDNPVRVLGVQYFLRNPDTLVLNVAFNGCDDRV